MKYLKTYESNNNNEDTFDNLRDLRDLINNYLKKLGIQYKAYTSWGSGSSTYGDYSSYTAILDDNKDVNLMYPKDHLRYECEEKNNIKLIFNIDKHPSSNLHHSEFVISPWIAEDDDYLDIEEENITNMKGFIEYVMKSYNINIGNIMKKINENIKTFEQFTDKFPTNINDFQKMISEYLDKLKIEYHTHTIWENKIFPDGRPGCIVQYFLRDDFAFQIMINSEFKPIIYRASKYVGVDWNENIENMNEFIQFLISYFEIDMDNVAKKINESRDFSKCTFPIDLGEFETLISKYLTKIGLTYKKVNTTDFDEDVVKFSINELDFDFSISNTVYVDYPGFDMSHKRNIISIIYIDRNRDESYNSIIAVNMEEFTKHLLSLSNIDMSNVAKKLNESNNGIKTFEKFIINESLFNPEYHKFPSNMNEFMKMVNNHLDKFKIDYVIYDEDGIIDKEKFNRTNWDHLHYECENKENIVMFDLNVMMFDNPDRTEYPFKEAGVITPITNPRLRKDNIKNLDEFTEYLTEVFGINMGNVMNRLNGLDL
tara:strand:- start:120350 stop:121972 length:1623 start_codon:yes stop_codon:yes gene_type:complete